MAKRYDFCQIFRVNVAMALTEGNEAAPNSE